jgi:4-nitrophenyl phosphatase
MAWVLDLDGVVRLGERPVPGAAAAVACLRSAGEQVAFVTNNASHRRIEVLEELRGFGLEVDPGEIATSAMAVASLVDPGDRVLVCAGPGVVEALGEVGAEVVTDGPCDAVVVGLALHVDYPLLARTAAAVRDGARFLASNTDPTYPTPHGLAPGAGSLVAAVTTAAGRSPDAVAGKPHEAMVELVRARLGEGGVVVGDRPDTDGRFAAALGYRFALVLSGVTRSEDVVGIDPPPDRVAPDLAAVVAAELGAGPG